MLRSFRLSYDALPGGRPAVGQPGHTPIAPPPTPPDFATTFGEMAVHVEVSDASCRAVTIFVEGAALVLAHELTSSPSHPTHPGTPQAQTGIAPPDQEWHFTVRAATPRGTSETTPGETKGADAGDAGEKAEAESAIQAATPNPMTADIDPILEQFDTTLPRSWTVPMVATWIQNLAVFTPDEKRRLNRPQHGGSHFAGFALVGSKMTQPLTEDDVHRATGVIPYLTTAELKAVYDTAGITAGKVPGFENDISDGEILYDAFKGANSLQGIIDDYFDSDELRPLAAKLWADLTLIDDASRARDARRIFAILEPLLKDLRARQEKGEDDEAFIKEQEELKGRQGEASNRRYAAVVAVAPDSGDDSDGADPAPALELVACADATIASEDKGGAGSEYRAHTVDPRDSEAAAAQVASEAAAAAAQGYQAHHGHPDHLMRGGSSSIDSLRTESMSAAGKYSSHAPNGSDGTVVAATDPIMVMEEKESVRDGVGNTCTQSAQKKKPLDLVARAFAATVIVATTAGAGDASGVGGVAPTAGISAPRSPPPLTDTVGGTNLEDWTTAVEKKDWNGMKMCGGVFTHASSTYGQCIIEGRIDTGDMQVFTAKKMGGIAGGKKFVVKNILFKFADPMGGPYNNSFELSQKAAAHDLRGATAFLHYQEDLGSHRCVCVSLQTLIDFAGFRLQAMQMLPIDGSTLIIGTGDACESLPHADPEACTYFKNVADNLGLAEHEIKVVRKDEQGKQTVRLHFGADVEGHRGKDGKLYVLDTARTFPSECFLTTTYVLK